MESGASLSPLQQIHGHFRFAAPAGRRYSLHMVHLRRVSAEDICRGSDPVRDRHHADTDQQLHGFLRKGHMDAAHRRTPGFRRALLPVDQTGDRLQEAKNKGGADM